MRVGLLIDPIDPSLTYTENLKKASDLGFEVVQLWHKDIKSHISEKPKEFQKKLRDLGLELKSLAAYTDILDPRRSWEDIYSDLKEAVRYAADSKVRYVVTESGGVPGKLDEWDEMITRFSQLADYGEKFEVIVLVENGPGVLVDGTDLMLRMMKEINSDYVGINFDPANLNLVPDNVVEAVSKLGNFIKDTHAKDSILLKNGTERHVPEEHIFVMPEGEGFIHVPRGVRWVLPPVGEGDVPFSDYIEALKKGNFSGDLIIEYQGGGSREEAIDRSKMYLEQLLGE
jgi:sugar phosphate isomerase/epimerase